jgi:hypothetical protein
MQGGAVRSHAYYRCKARTIAPGSPLLADHPNTVNVREDFIARAINGWVGELFAPDKRDETVRARWLHRRASWPTSRSMTPARRRLTEGGGRVEAVPAAIAAGAEPSAVVDVAPCTGVV